MIGDINIEKPIVFLDIDGVLNSTRFFHRDNPLPKNDKRSHLDSSAINHLNEIADWNFVLSSSWRKYHDIDSINNMLSSMGFKGKILDYTPVLNWKGRVRGNEIAVWLGDNKMRDSKNYVIFDDDSDMLYSQRNNFVHVDNYFGLGPNHVWRAKKMLNL